MFDRDGPLAPPSGACSSSPTDYPGATGTTMTPHYDLETFIDYLHGALAPEADAAVFDHLQTCSACDAVYDQEAALGEALRSAARAQELEFPSMIKARVWDAVRQDKPSWLPLLRAGWAPRIAVPVAAGVILGGC